MKISILLPDLRGGGVERIRIVLAHEFARAGHDVEFVLMQARGELLEEAQAYFSCVDLDTPRFRSLIFPLARYLRRSRPDALLAAMWPLTGIAGLALALSGHSARLVASEHTDFRRKKTLKRFERFLLKRFGRFFYSPFHSVVAISAGVAESLQEVVGLPAARVVVIYNPVRFLSQEEIPTSDLQRLAGWFGGGARLIAIGNFSPAKGFDVLLHAVAELQKKTDVRLLILGDGPLRNELEILANDLGISESVWLPGFRMNPLAYLKSANVFVLSSNWEGFGNVIVEALSAGVPVVSTNCQSGPAEILCDGEYGKLVPVGDKSAMSATIYQTLLEPPASDRLIKRAKNFDPAKQAKLYLAEIFDD